ncbi:hypothetical protein GCM10027355_35940 [Haloplanus salinarum]|uniref:hypothetical protein n=1 Tax=Haloplanus salinarum TaxID=1912324 RepID=UPI003B43438E
MTDDTPVNFTHIAESFELAMKAHDQIPDDAADEVVNTVEEAVANHEGHLMWESDYDEFMAILDGVLDGIYDNGYGEQVKQLDDLRAKLEPIDE